jgi:4-alpha-glucanotransferase
MTIDPSKKIAGLLVPLFAVRGRHDLGIGDTSSLSELVEWAAGNGIRAVQVLPVNETGGDHSPYNVLSAFALDPATITTHPSWIPELTPGDYRTVAARHDLTALREGPVDYTGVKALKRELLEAAWERFRRGDGRSGRARLFSAFLDLHASWLGDYTLHRVLLERAGGSEETGTWPEGTRTAESARVWLDPLSAEERNEISDRRLFFAYVQWIAFSQWNAVADLAETLGVALVGDVPVGVAPGGTDVFANPGEFDLGRSCGAPPEKVFKSDPFTEQWGQNWGFPLYRWEAMGRNDFSWWRRRLGVLRSVFHLLRVDHALGFFRIYSFPWNPRRNAEFTGLTEDEARALTGGPLPGFVERDDSTPENRAFNERHGEVLLGMLATEAGKHRIVAEDLGEVAPYVRPVLERMELPGFKIPMWERDSSGHMLSGESYARISIATYATHDHAPMAVQWEEWRAGLRAEGAEAEGCRRILSELLRFAGIPEVDPDTPFEGNVHESLIKALLDSNSWIAVVMITDLFGTTQRFNVPGAVGSANWTARIAEPVSEWNSLHAGLLSRWKEAVKAAGRV